MTDEKLREAIAINRRAAEESNGHLWSQGVISATERDTAIAHNELVCSAAESWLNLAPIRGSEVTEAGWYLASFGNGWSDGPWQFDGDLWHSYPGDDSVEPDWAIPWAALPPVPGVV